MTLLHPWFLLVCLLAAWPLMADRLRSRGAGSHLPGAWQRLVSREMRGIVAGQVRVTHDRLGALTTGALWLVLGLALAGPVVQTEPSAAVSNLAGRVVVVDLSDADGGAAVRSMARTVAAGQTGLPMALVAATGDAFDVVPFTTDLQHFERYLAVLEPALMPVGGHEPHRAIAHAEAMLVRAGMIAGQVVLITSATAVPSRKLARDRWLRAIVHVSPGGQPPPAIRALAEETNATLVMAAESPTLDRQLAQTVSGLVDGSPDLSGQMPLQPWLAGLAGIFWLLLFRRSA